MAESLASFDSIEEEKAFNEGYKEGYDEALADAHSALAENEVGNALALSIIEDLINA